MLIQAVVNKVNEYSSDSSLSSLLSSDIKSSYQVCQVIYGIQMNALRHPEEQCILCNQKDHEARTYDIMINYILAKSAVCKDPLLKEKIIKSFKYFHHYRQFTPSNYHCTNK